jgi:carbonic anhydrase
VVNCMDGRVQTPVIDYLKKRFGARYVDNVTEAGPNRILADGRPAAALQRIMRRIRISPQKHGSRQIAIVGHWDCGGNPAPRARQVDHLRRAADVLKSAFPSTTVIAVWVNEDWRVTEIPLRHCLKGSPTPGG